MYVHEYANDYLGSRLRGSCTCSAGGGGPTRNDEEEAPAGEPIYLKGGELIAYRR